MKIYQEMNKSLKVTTRPKVFSLFSLKKKTVTFYKKNAYGEESDEENDDELPLELVAKFDKPQKVTKNSRSSVSAEAYGQYLKKNDDYKARVIPKNEYQIERIKARISQVFMFSSLEGKEVDILVSAFEEKTFKFVF